MTAPAPSLRDRIAAAARTVQLRLGPNALAMAQRGEPIILNYGEADALADAVLPLLAAEREAGRRDGLREGADLIANHPGAIPYRPQMDKDGGFWWDTRDRDAAADILRARADTTHPGGQS